MTVAADDESATLNFKDVDIQAVIDFVSRETGTNFIVDPRVQGRVTMLSGRPVTRDEIYDVFLAMLRVHGFAAVAGDGVVKVIPDAAAKQAEVPTIAAGETVADDAYVTQVLTLEEVNASLLVPILRPLIPQNGHLAASPETNSLIVSDTAANVRRVVEIARRIDRDNREDLEVVKLHNNSASQVVQVLRTMSGGNGKDAPAQQRIMADDRSNSVLISGDARKRAELRAIVRELDVAVAGGNTQVVYLRHADAAEIAEVLQGMVSTSGPVAGGEGVAPAAAPGERAVSIQAHESTNALVLRGPADMVRDLSGVIPQLDVRRAQVLVEAVIAEVSSESAAELGVQWAVGSPGSALGVVNFGRTGSGIAELAAGIHAFLEGTVSSPPSLGDGAILGGAGRIGSVTIGALVRALAADTSNNILSTPTLLTMDNAEAEIVVGQNVPFIVGRSIEQSGQAFDTIERQDVGVKLRVRPQINEGDAVKLEVSQEVSQIASSASAQGAADLITNKRSLRTSVMVEDGEIVVLGGLIDDQLVQTRDKVPGLGDIPALGSLFRYESARKEKRNLMVFLHPVIIRDRVRQRGVTEPRYQAMRDEQQRSRGRDVLMMSEDVVPVLPSWEELLRLPPPFDAARDVPGKDVGAVPEPPVAVERRDG